jgi:hypothetical protein
MHPILLMAVYVSSMATPASVSSEHLRAAVEDLALQEAEKAALMALHDDVVEEAVIAGGLMHLQRGLRIFEDAEILSVYYYADRQEARRQITRFARDKRKLRYDSEEHWEPRHTLPVDDAFRAFTKRLLAGMRAAGREFVQRSSDRRVVCYHIGGLQNREVVKIVGKLYRDVEVALVIGEKLAYLQVRQGEKSLVFPGGYLPPDVHALIAEWVETDD